MYRDLPEALRTATFEWNEDMTGGTFKPHPDFVRLFRDISDALTVLRERPPRKTPERSVLSHTVRRSVGVYSTTQQLTKSWLIPGTSTEYDAQLYLTVDGVLCAGTKDQGIWETDMTQLSKAELKQLLAGLRSLKRRR